MNSILDQGAPLSDASGALQLPTEVALQVLAFCRWGDLARLACVQRSFAPLVLESATSSDRSASSNAMRWDLAQSLLRGTGGLAVNKPKAVHLLKELAGVPVDPETHAPVVVTAAAAPPTDDNSDSGAPREAGFAPAMRLIADLYLDGEILAPAVTASEASASDIPTPSTPSSSSSDGTTADDATAAAANSARQSTPNAALGVRWLQSAFEMGDDVDAAHDLALLYEHGRRSVELDVVRAAEWLLRAAEKGHVEAMAEIGLCYELGCGVPQNDEHALDWYMKAAEKGSLVAKYSVGEAFEEARGVPMSLEEACLWYHKAAREGDDDAKDALRRLRDVARIVLPGVGALLDG
jgi:TPR repeat protein